MSTINPTAGRDRRRRTLAECYFYAGGTLAWAAYVGWYGIGWAAHVTAALTTVGGAVAAFHAGRLRAELHSGGGR